MIKVSYKDMISNFIKKELRKSVNAHKSCPVIIIAGNNPPKLLGQSFHYENKSGDRIWHPNAYRAKWGKPIYVRSTLRVEVGSDWLLSNLSLCSLKEHRLRAFK